MDAQSYVEARAKFAEQLTMIRRPWHRSTPLYNIACCDALLGDTESALSFLEQAIQCGFRDVEHMKSDVDLESLRGLEKFQTLLETAAVAQPPCSRWPSFGRGRQEWFELQQQALALMDSKTPEGIKQARELFEKQIKLSPHPWGQRIPLYNIACCEALLGNSEEAIRILQEAVNAGYRNLKHIQGDEDLESLRELEGYQQVIASVKSGHRCKSWWRFGAERPAEESEQSVEQPAEQAAEESEQPIEEPVEEPAIEPEQPQSGYFASLPEEFEYLRTQLEVLAQMGFVELKQNLKALTGTKGDIAAAIERLLQ
jgi:tetratricopeptide (TPR) repeat protein